MAETEAERLPILRSSVQAAELRATELKSRARASEEAADSLAADVAKLVERRKSLEVELEDWRGRGRQASEQETALHEQLSSVLEHATSGVRSLTRQQLEEVRSLQNPPPVVRCALGLVYCILHPEMVGRFSSPADVPWKEKLAPMLKRDDLVRQLAEFPPPAGQHPLLAFPAAAEFIECHVAASEQADTSLDNTGERRRSSAGGTLRRGSKKASAAAKNAARLLQAQPSSDDAGGVASPSIKRASSIVRSGSLEEAASPSSRRNSGVARSSSAALLGTDDKLTVEAVKFASKAVGALFVWVLSQLQYVRKLKEIAADNLENQAAAARLAVESVKTQVDEKEKAVEVVRAQEETATIAASEAQSQHEIAEQEAVQAACEVKRLWQEVSIAETAAETERARREAEAAAESRRRQSQAAAEAERVRRMAQDALQSASTAVEPEPQLEKVLDRGEIAVSSVEVEVRERVNFASGSTVLSSVATRALHGVIDIMQTHGDIKLCVEGHSRPDEADSVSTVRANRVLDHLVAQGIPRHRLRSAGFGSAFPEAKNETSARVEFSVIQEISIKGTVQFGSCSDHLTSSSGPLLEKVVALLAARPCLRIRIEGHTDNCPNWGCSNQELSEGRAQNVVQYLKEHGIDDSRLAPVGFGDVLPRMSNSSREGRTRNRRVEFHVLQRETVQGLQELLDRSKECGQIDLATLQQLQRTAIGSAIGLALPIRRAAADLLGRLHCDWPMQRLLFIAARKEDPQNCVLACLPEDCVRRVLRFYFLLGCSSLAQPA